MSDTGKTKAPVTRPRSLGLWLLTVFILLVVLPLLALAAVLLALRSEAGTAWVLEQVPGLEVTDGQGSLLGLWRADSLVWKGFGVSLGVQAPLLSWSPGCLINKEICLDRLQAEEVKVDLPPPEADSARAGAVQLPELNLPLTLTVGLVELGPLTIDGNPVWDSFGLGAKGSGSDWLLSRLSVQRDDIGLDVSGRLETRGDWPLDLAVQVQLPRQQGKPWLLDLGLTGSAADLVVRGNSEGYLNASVSGGVEPLKPALPARIRVKAQDFRATDDLPETLTLQGADISAQGSLASGFQLKGTARLPGTGGDIWLAVKGLVTTTGIQELDLALTGPGTVDTGAGTASVKGSLSWQQTLALDAQIALDAFPWFSLIPGVEPPPVILRRLDGQVDYQGGEYQANLTATVDGPQGSADISSRIEGNLESLELSQLSVNTGAGSLTGAARLGFSGPLNWDANLQLNDFNPGYWVPALEASLDGRVASKGSLSETGPRFYASWDLQGSWRKSETEIRGSLEQFGDTLAVSGLQLQLGDNRVTGHGRWGPELDGELELDLPLPQMLLPGLDGLEGALTGRISLSGTKDSPQGQASLSGRDVRWREQVSLDQFDLLASLSVGQVLNAELTATKIEGFGQLLDTLKLDLSGTREKHRLEIAASHPDAELLLALTGALGKSWSNWQGQLDQGEIDVVSQDQFWRLDQPTDLAYSESGRLTLGQHCWRWQQASVCAGQQILLPDPSLDYRVRNFPTTALAPLLPTALRWQTLLNADLSLQTTANGPEGAMLVDAGEGTFSVLNAGQWQSFEYNTLSARVDLLPREAVLAMAVQGPKLGDISTRVSIDPQSQTRDLDGQFRIVNLDIALAAAFAGLEEVKGLLNGQGQISGPLMKPAVNGELVLSGGEVSDPSLPLPLQDMEATLKLEGYQAALSGRWKSNDRSSGALNGRLVWESAPEVSLQLTGQRLPLQYDPYANVEVEPDLQLDYGPDGLSVRGTLAVPRGSIEISRLPDQAVSVSEDEVIVGAEQQETPPMTLDMNVTVVVGEDRVSFNGFEVIGDLEGTLRIANDMDTRGSLRLIDGRYEAYGQELKLRRARLLFTGPIAEPYLDIEAIRRVDTVVAGIRLSGPISAPQTEVFSEPSMPQTDALSYLILGRAPQSKSDDGQMRNAAISLGLNQASEITRGLGEGLGIRDLTLEAQGSGNQAAVVASGYLTDELSVRYGVGLFDPINTVALRYDLGRYFFLEAASGLSSSLDIFYTRDF